MYLYQILLRNICKLKCKIIQNELFVLFSHGEDKKIKYQQILLINTNDLLVFFIFIYFQTKTPFQL